MLFDGRMITSQETTDAMTLVLDGRVPSNFPFFVKLQKILRRRVRMDDSPKGGMTPGWDTSIDDYAEDGEPGKV